MTTTFSKYSLLLFLSVFCRELQAQAIEKDSLLLEISKESKELEERIFGSNVFAMNREAGLKFLKSIEIEGEVSYGLSGGTISDYFGVDSSDFLVRNTLSGSLRKSIGPMDAQISFGLTDLKNNFGRNNYFTLDFVPSIQRPSAEGLTDLGLKNSIRSRLKDSIAALDSKLSQMESNLDVKIDQGYRQLSDLKSERAKLNVPSYDTVGSARQADLNKRIEILEKSLRVLSTAKSKIRSSKNNLDLMGEKLDMDYLESLKTNSTKKAKHKKGLLSFDRLQIGRSGFSLPTPGTMSTPMNGVSISYSKNKWFFDHAVGVTQNNMFALNPLDSVLLEGNSSNFFKQLRNYSTRPVASNAFGYGKRQGDKLAFETAFIGEDIALPSGDGQIINRVKYQKALPWKVLLYGSLAHNQMVNDHGGDELEKMSHTVGVRYQMKKTRTKLQLENQTLGRAVDLSGVGFGANDFNYTNVVVTQRISKQLELVLGYDHFVDNLSTSKSRTTKIQNYIPKLIIRPIEGLDVALGAVFNSVDESESSLSRQSTNTSLDFSSSYRFEIAERKTSVKAGYVKNTIYNFTDLFVLQRLVGSVKSEITESTELSYTFNELNQSLGGGVEGMHARISTLGLNVTKESVTFGLEGSYSKDLRAFKQDFGGSAFVTLPIGKSIVIEAKVKRHVLGSYVSMFQPKRFEFNPYEGTISLTKKI